MTGVYRPDSGKIELDGEDITGKSVVQINKDGIARTFQNIRLFNKLSVLDNVKSAYTIFINILQLQVFLSCQVISKTKGL